MADGRHPAAIIIAAPKADSTFCGCAVANMLTTNTPRPIQKGRASGEATKSRRFRRVAGSEVVNIGDTNSSRSPANWHSRSQIPEVGSRTIGAALLFPLGPLRPKEALGSTSQQLNASTFSSMSAFQRFSVFSSAATNAVSVAGISKAFARRLSSAGSERCVSNSLSLLSKSSQSSALKT